MKKISKRETIYLSKLPEQFLVVKIVDPNCSNLSQYVLADWATKLPVAILNQDEFDMIDTFVIRGALTVSTYKEFNFKYRYHRRIMARVYAR